MKTRGFWDCITWSRPFGSGVCFEQASARFLIQFGSTRINRKVKRGAMRFSRALKPIDEHQGHQRQNAVSRPFQERPPQGHFRRRIDRHKRRPMNQGGADKKLDQGAVAAYIEGDKNDHGAMQRIQE